MGIRVSFFQLRCNTPHHETNGRKARLRDSLMDSVLQLGKIARTWNPSRTAPERSLLLPCLWYRTPPLSLFLPTSTAISKQLLSRSLLLLSTSSSIYPSEIFLLSLCSAYRLRFRKGSSCAQLPSLNFSRTVVRDSALGQRRKRFAKLKAANILRPSH